MGFRVWGLELRVEGSRFGVQGLAREFKDSGSKLGVQSSGLRVEGLGFRVEG